MTSAHCLLSLIYAVLVTLLSITEITENAEGKILLCIMNIHLETLVQLNDTYVAFLLTPSASMAAHFIIGAFFYYFDVNKYVDIGPSSTQSDDIDDDDD